MRTWLLHIAGGYSLRETVVLAKSSGIADVSDVALLKRLRRAEEWFKALAGALFRESGMSIPRCAKQVRMRLVDGTIVKEPGKTGSQWRFHYRLQIPKLICDSFKLLPANGEGVGESFEHFPVNKNDCVIGDRGYSTARGIRYITDQQGHVIVRVNTAALKFHHYLGAPFDLLKAIGSLLVFGQLQEWSVVIPCPDSGHIEGGVCAIRKSEHAIQLALKKLRREASKKQKILQPETLEYAQYVIVFTTLPVISFQVADVLEWYRVRWQMELIFKRLKSLTGLGHLPKYDEASSRAWLYGKLFIGLLTEKLLQYATRISPWGYLVAKNGCPKQLA